MTVAARSLAECPRCKGEVDVKSPHVAIDGASVRVYCSAECLQARDTPMLETVQLPLAPKRRRLRWWILGATVVGASAAVIAAFALRDDDVQTSPMLGTIPVPSETPALAIAGADDPRRLADDQLLVDLMHDAWLHPLAGPLRRMPRTHNGAFGAERGGARPPECISGHCGVDLGYVWGEPVHAVHDGVVDTVNRGPNEERGGIYVKVAHRGGTLYSWYFHLAAVPRWVQPGVKVTAGQVIGLVGDTGIVHSAPHLHFAMSVKPTNSTFERYLDPEPLIAIWPLWIPKDHESGTLSTTDEPGVPVRATGRRKKASKRKSEPAANEPVTSPTPTPAEPSSGEPGTN